MDTNDPPPDNSDRPFNQVADHEFEPTDTDTDAGADPDADADTETDTDGRTLRRRRNRNAVIDALIALIREGTLAPTVAQIADRAGVSHRSIFRYFDDLNDLARTAIETEFRDVIVLATIPEPGEGSLDHRIDTIVSKQLATLYRTHLLGRVARGRMIDIPEIDRGLANITEFRLEQLRRQFAPELDAMDDARRDAILTALAMTVGFESYDMQRRTLERTPGEIGRNWRTSLQTLLT